MRVEIQLDTGEQKVFQSEPVPVRAPTDVRQVKVLGSLMREYRLTTVNGDAVACTCYGFHYKGSCRHIREYNRL